MILLAAALLSMTALVIAGYRWWLGNGVLRTRERQTVIVTLKSGAAFRGALFDFDARTMVLRGAEALYSSAPPAPVDGEVLILLAEVDFIQRP